MTESANSSSSTEAPVNLTGEYLGQDDARNLAVEDNELDGYIGVSAEYMNYADETHKPFSTSEEVIPTVEQLAFEEADDGDDDKDAQAVKPSQSTSTKSTTTSSSKKAESTGTGK